MNKTTPNKEWTNLSSKRTDLLQILKNKLNFEDSNYLIEIFKLIEEQDKDFIRRDKNINPEHLARIFHKSYEFNSRQKGWETQKSCQVEFDDLHEENKQTMIATCEEVIRVFLNKRTEKLAGKALI